MWPKTPTWLAYTNTSCISPTELKNEKFLALVAEFWFCRSMRYINKVSALIMLDLLVRLFSFFRECPDLPQGHNGRCQKTSPPQQHASTQTNVREWKNLANQIIIWSDDSALHLLQNLIFSSLTQLRHKVGSTAFPHKPCKNLPKRGRTSTQTSLTSAQLRKGIFAKLSRKQRKWFL